MRVLQRRGRRPYGERDQMDPYHGYRRGGRPVSGAYDKDKGV